MWNKLANPLSVQKITGVDVAVEELIALRHTIIHDSKIFKKNTRALMAGNNFAKIRGRGIEFDGTREYQPGDDIRRMAWRVTARSLKPHIKIYHEEKERPVWLAIDLSPSMYFGTRRMFKSVRALKQAASLGWQYLYQRERIGAVIATTQKTLVYKPKSRERDFLSVLKALSECSLQQPSFNADNKLYDLLVTLQQQLRSGNSLFIISDFSHFDARHQKMLLHFTQRVQIHLVLVYDPFEAKAPPPNQYLLTDGETTALLNMDKRENRERYEQQFQQKLDEIVVFSRNHNIALQILRTDQEQEVHPKL